MKTIIALFALPTLTLLASPAEKISLKFDAELEKLNTEKLVRKKALEDEFKKKRKSLAEKTLVKLKALQKQSVKSNNIKMVSEYQKQIDKISQFTADKKILLKDLKPSYATAAQAFRIDMKTSHYTLPKISGEEHKHSYFAHAPSKLEYKIPQGVSKLTGFGSCPAPTKWNGDGVKFIVKIDDKEVYKSSTIKSPRKLARFDLDLPLKAEKVSFIVDKKDHDTADHSFWMDVEFSE